MKTACFSGSPSCLSKPMASVPSISCLLAKNQYYRKPSISSVNSLTGPDSADIRDDEKPLQGLPEVAESNWWFKSFFCSETVLSNVGGKDLSASGTHT
ncbi:pancreatic progenitor cell differentiation and proliferation factor-like protein isoform X2 [Cavia porcellus]|uniref:pancreatic progenitor cell differentiation and proliferation factor-like protein isoform X2 n=1 Tax=Cavia porcellus TaxID=10141 RepID=UPI000661943A|nr:pancreatic progenitor cell differentiation and proliferation factor-like protein isoform X2 [Cavia porcellus]